MHVFATHEVAPAELVLSRLHAVQALLAVAVEKKPTGQLVQFHEATEFENFPAGHAV